MYLKMEIRNQRRGAEEAELREGLRAGLAIWSHHLVRALKRLKSRAPEPAGAFALTLQQEVAFCIFGRFSSVA